MITVRIQGGLGNQMFQYAYARAMQSCGKSVRMHWHPPKRKALHTGYTLDSIFVSKLNQNVPLSNENLLSPLCDTLRRKLSRVRQGDNVGYDTSFMEFDSGYIDGYFQSEKYFINIATEIRHEFKFKPLAGSKNLELADWIEKNFVVAVHIRGGDYLNRGHMQGDMASVCGRPYYREALEVFSKKYPEANYLVFTDDLEYAKNVMSGYTFKFVDWNSGQNSWMDMSLMSKCSAHITANSSFSWWASWLANSHLRIMPEPWFPEFADTYNNDIYLDGCIKITQKAN